MAATLRSPIASSSWSLPAPARGASTLHCASVRRKAGSGGVREAAPVPNRSFGMAQVFPPVSMAGLGMALADVALAKQLVAVLAELEGPCGALRNELVVP